MAKELKVGDLRRFEQGVCIVNNNMINFEWLVGVVVGLDSTGVYIYIGNTKNSNQNNFVYQLVAYETVKVVKNMPQDTRSRMLEEAKTYYTKIQANNVNEVGEKKKNMQYEKLLKRAKEHGFESLLENLDDSYEIKVKLFHDCMDKVNWCKVTESPNLTETFIREFPYRVDWCFLSYNRKLSEPLMRDFADELDWKGVASKQKLSKEFRQEFASKLSKTIMENNWFYKSSTYKKQKLEETGAYDCYKDYFICYVVVDKDGYFGNVKRQKYEAGKVRECFTSFLVYNKQYALRLCGGDETILKIKVYYEDVRQVSKDATYIFCDKLECLENIH